MRKLYAFFVTLLFFTLGAVAQPYQVNGSASASANPNEFQLIPPTSDHVRGSVFSTVPLNLSQNFEITAKLYFGTDDAGGDGMAFILQNEGTGYTGNYGAGIGYHRFNGTYPSDIGADVPGPVPSFITEFDTYQNGLIGNQDVGDPAADHLGFMSQSNAYHTSSSALSPAQPFSDNIEDGEWHDAKFTWNVQTQIFTVQFTVKNAPLLIQTFTYTGNIAAFFPQNSTIYWGFTAGVGHALNEEKIQLTSIVVTTPQSPLTLEGSTTNATCNSGGAIDITLTGGVVPYTYSWSNGSTSEDLANLAPGSYNVTVTDHSGNIKTGTYSIANNCLSPVTVTAVTDNTSCASGGNVNITVSGGRPGYTYSWSNGATTEDLVNVAAGSYTVTVTDANKVIKTADFTVANGCITITGVVTNASCTGGAVNITVSGGTPGYTYSWSNGSTSEDLTNVAAGSYTVTVKDANNVTKQATFNVGNNGCAQQINITGVVTNAACGTNGKIDITPSGGSGNYTYTWSNGAHTQDLVNIPAGTYTVTVKDAANALNTKQASFTVSNSDNIAPQLSCAGTDKECYNLFNYYSVPALTATDNCGIATINYVITGATARSGTGKNASGFFNPGISSITWTVKDLSGNTATCTTVVTVSKVNITIPDVYAVNPGGNANTIYLGYGPASLTLTANASGGAGGYSYLWITGAATQSITVTPSHTGIYTYIVLVTDAAGCSSLQVKFVRVVDVRCGNNKVTVCHTYSATRKDELCVNKTDVAAHLLHGDKLGSCTNDDDDDDHYYSRANPSQNVTENTVVAGNEAVYPNPTKGSFTLHASNTRAGSAQVIIFNANGTIVERRSVQLGVKGQTLQLDLSGKASGVYLVKLITEDGIQTEKIVVQR